MSAIPPSVIEPGRSIEVTVTLRIGLGAGQVLHVAEIETEGGENPNVELRTSATAHARATVEEVDEPSGPLEPGQSRRVEYLVRSFGLAGDPPPALGDGSIRCGLPTDWVGAPTGRKDDESGLDEVRRALAVTLPASVEPGPRSAALEVVDGGGAVVGRRWLAWVVAPALKASPSGLIFATDAQAAEGLKVVIRGHDGRTFRIISATTELAGLKVVVDGDDARPIHQLTARFDGPARQDGSRPGEIVIRTDHPGQPVVKVAVLVTGRGTGGAPRDAKEASR